MVYKNKVALITGGSSGIGLALARALSAEGAHVWVMAHHQDKLDTALNEIRAVKQDPNQNFGAISGDVTDWEQVTSAVAKVSQEAGIPDLLINSAGVAQPGYVQDQDIEIFRWMMEVNYFGTIYATKACLPAMIQRRSGHIVNISSVTGFLGVFGYSAYGASKFAVAGFSDVLRAEMKPYGIKVSIVYPQDTETPQLAYETQYRPVETQALESGSKIISAEEVARIILRDVARGRYAILTGPDANIYYRLTGLVGDLVYPVMDFMLARSRKKINDQTRYNGKKPV
jgi:3-dehydrosphinganine reductase